MKRRMSLKKPNKKTVAYFAATACLVVAVGISGYSYHSNGGFKTQTTTVKDEVLSASAQDVLSEEVKDYISTYFQTTSVNEYISEEDMATIIAKITAGVMNSLPESGLTSDDQLLIRDMIATAVKEEVEIINQASDTTGTTTVLTSELEKYIESTIVPNITANIQIYKGQVEDLKSSLANLSDKYNKSQAEYDRLINNIYNKMSTLNSSGASQKELDQIKEDLDSLSEILVNYKSASSTKVTTLEQELTIARQELNIAIENVTRLSNAQLEEMKTSLLQQISAIDGLLDEERRVLEESINNLTSEQVQSRETLKAALEENIRNSGIVASENLNNAVNTLNGTIDNVYANIDNLNQSVADLSGMMGGCSISYDQSTDSFYITYKDEGGAGSVTKKLDYAP